MCFACPAGSYSSVPGATSAATCVPCPAGKYSSSAGSSQCTSCNAGSYSAVVGATTSSTCSACSAGSYSSVSGATSAVTCVPCPAGTYSSSAGAIQCTGTCSPGSYSVVIGAISSSTCTACAAGYYSMSGQSQCTVFPTGTTNSIQPTNFITVYGHKYATLANTNPSLGGATCQYTYLSLPVGWIIAPNNCQSWFALGCNYWQTYVAVLADGTAYDTQQYYTDDSSPWTYRGSGWLGTSWNGQFASSYCDGIVFITDDVSAASAPCSSNPYSCTLCGTGSYSTNGATPCKS